MVGQSGEVEFLESSDAARKITEQTDETVQYGAVRLESRKRIIIRDR
jgi:hypothetical protein